MPHLVRDVAVAGRAAYYRGSYRLILGSRPICLFEHSSSARNGFRLTADYRGSCRLTPYYRGSYRLILGTCLICLFERSSLAQNGFRLTVYYPRLNA